MGNANYFHESCHLFNNHVSEEIIKLRPKTVIISGRWDHYGKDVIDEQIDGTVAFIKESGINKIILVGPSPHWIPDLPKALYSFFKNDLRHLLPDRMWRGLDLKIRVMDKDLHEKADRLGIIYVSPFNALCNAEGCLTRVGDKPEDLVVYDNVHFSPTGSRFFINKVFANLPIT